MTNSKCHLTSIYEQNLKSWNLCQVSTLGSLKASKIRSLHLPTSHWSGCSGHYGLHRAWKTAALQRVTCHFPRYLSPHEKNIHLHNVQGQCHGGLQTCKPSGMHSTTNVGGPPDSTIHHNADMAHVRREVQMFYTTEL